MLLEKIKLLSGLLRIIYEPYAIAALLVLLIYWRSMLKGEWRSFDKKLFFYFLIIGVIAFSWRFLINIGTKRYGLFLVFPVILLLSSLPLKKRQVWDYCIRCGLLILIGCALVKDYLCYNRYSDFVMNSAQKIHSDMIKHPSGSKAALLSYDSRGGRIAFLSGIETYYKQTAINRKKMFAEILTSLNYFRYRNSPIFIIFSLPTEEKPPTARDLGCADGEWEMIYFSFINNKQKAKSYIFRYIPAAETLKTTLPVKLLANGDFEHFSRKTVYSQFLIDENPAFYRNAEHCRFPTSWNILRSKYFRQDACAEIFCRAQAGKTTGYSLEMASRTPIFIYNSKPEEIIERAELSLRLRPKENSEAVIWAIIGTQKDQVSNCLYRPVARILLTNSLDNFTKYQFPIENSLEDNKTMWIRWGIELKYGRIELDDMGIWQRKK